jgi:hypothetical protein
MFMLGVSVRLGKSAVEGAPAKTSHRNQLSDLTGGASA